MPVVSSSLPSSGAKRLDVRTIVCTGMLCAISYVVMFLSKTIFAPLTVAGFLTFDMKDVIIAIGGFLYGPLNALCISLVTSVIEMFTVSETGPIGLLMNVLSTIAFACPAAFIYKRRQKLSGAVAGLLGLPGAQPTGAVVGGARVERATAVTVGGLRDGGDLLLAFLERGLGGVRVSRRLIGGRGRLVQRDGGFVEVFARDLRVLHRGCGAGVDFGDLDLDLGDAHLRGLFGSLGGSDLFLRGGGLRHLGQHEEGAGGDSRQARANGSASSHRCLISSN